MRICNAEVEGPLAASGSDKLSLQGSPWCGYPTHTSLSCLDRPDPAKCGGKRAVMPTSGISTTANDKIRNAIDANGISAFQLWWQKGSHANIRS